MRATKSAAVFVLGVVAACGRGDVGPATSQDTELLRPEMLIGADESDPTTLFTFVTGLRGEASGHILVSDIGVSELSVFDSTGAATLKISGIGDGPGEVQRPLEAAFVGDELVVYDLGHNAYLWYSKRGEPLARIPNPFGARGLDPLFTTPSGYVVEGTRRTEPQSSFVVRRFRRSPEGPTIDPQFDSIVVHHDPRRAVAVGGATFVPVPMSTGPSWATLGEDIVVSTDGDYVLERRSFAGEIDTLFTRAAGEDRLIPIPSALHGELVEGFEAVLRSQAERQGLPSNTFFDEAEIPTHFPAVMGIIAAPDERIWVLTGSASGEPSLDLIDSTGEHLGTVRLQVDKWPDMLVAGIAASSSHLLLVAESALGTQVVHAFRIPDELRARD